MTTIKQYLIDRLAELGGKHMFGVPGNYNAEFLLAAQRSGKLTWIGTSNEMEAGYAADAYARLTRRIGICCVTYGVGSLSALNAFAGSYVEVLPVVLINGSAPTTKVEQLISQGVLFAHAIDTMRTDEHVFRQITDPFRSQNFVLTAVISDPFEAPAQIDAVLGGCLATGRPVYIEVLQDLWGQHCADPAGPLAAAPEIVEPQEQAVAARAAATAILDRLERAKRPVLWGGELLQRLQLEREFQTLVDALGIPYTTTLMAKGLISETDNAHRFIGVYDSAFAPANIRQVVEDADCLIGLGTILSDFYGIVAKRAQDQLVVAARRSVRVMGDTYQNVPLDLLVRDLVKGASGGSAASRSHAAPSGFAELIEARNASPPLAMAAATANRAARLTWDSFFERMRGWAMTPAKGEDRVYLVDTSVALFPSAAIPLQVSGRWVAQTAWLSIGYTVGAALGAGTAVPGGRPIAFVGDGGFQMIPQAFSTLARQKIPAILFVFDNGIYAVEQYLVDMQVLPADEKFFPNPGTEPSFFDVLPRWDYVKLAEGLHGIGYAVQTHAELEAVLEALADERERPAIVAVELDSRDLPQALRDTFGPQTSARALLGEIANTRQGATTVVAAAFD
ncbi:thiamine pyrophosphate-binding protein [Rhodoblastus sp.]|jgi:indolepyruvate decarboxylase|uniref:thiamine pyrophosphate-binding protein n=1 Tax=Rhodoblastus sp. TaxID=1962975 RepID=UPI0025F7F58C|nr:thiamine pyrophosphate-binding protein [Rhodoblastus sp.]